MRARMTIDTLNDKYVEYKNLLEEAEQKKPGRLIVQTVNYFNEERENPKDDKPVVKLSFDPNDETYRNAIQVEMFDPEEKNESLTRMTYAMIPLPCVSRLIAALEIMTNGNVPRHELFEVIEE